MFSFALVLVGWTFAQVKQLCIHLPDCCWLKGFDTEKVQTVQLNLKLWNKWVHFKNENEHLHLQNFDERFYDIRWNSDLKNEFWTCLIITEVGPPNRPALYKIRRIKHILSDIPHNLVTKNWWRDMWERKNCHK